MGLFDFQIFWKSDENHSQHHFDFSVSVLGRGLCSHAPARKNSIPRAFAAVSLLSRYDARGGVLKRKTARHQLGS